MFVKYAKTFHLPWSPGLQNDDRVVPNLDVFRAKQIVITEKMDGENTSLYANHLHARSLDSRHHPSRDWVKMFHGQIKSFIPAGWRICGENMYAEHSIAYDDLDSYFLGFSVWDDQNRCLPWDETLDVFEILGITPVPTWWTGSFEEFESWHQLWDVKVKDQVEGYVIRNTSSFHYDSFGSNVAKFVRKDHIQTDEHWMAKPVVPNKLKV